MYMLPVEVLQPIFQSACSDNGTTGLSLSLVSRYISEASKPFKYQRLVIHSDKHAEKLLEWIQSNASTPNFGTISLTAFESPRADQKAVSRIPSDHSASGKTTPESPHTRKIRGGIRGLFGRKKLSKGIADPIPYYSSSSNTHVSLAGPSAEDLFLAALNGRPIVRRLLDTLPDILETCASTLRHLDLNITTTLQFNYNTIPVLPALTSLKLSHSETYSGAVLSSPQLNFLFQLPALKYFDLSGFISFPDFDLLDCLELMAPHVTHLRIYERMTSCLKPQSGYGGQDICIFVQLESPEDVNSCASVLLENAWLRVEDLSREDSRIFGLSPMYSAFSLEDVAMLIDKIRSDG